MTESDFWLLDALVDGPSSVAASLVWIREAWTESGSESLSVERHLRTIRRLEVAGLIEVRVCRDGQLVPVRDSEWSRVGEDYAAWLSGVAAISGADVAHDRVGVWMSLTDAGRDEWSQRAERPPSDLWQANYDSTSQLISVTAADLAAAQTQAVELASQLGLELHSQTELERHEDGTVTLRYRTVQPTAR